MNGIVNYISEYLDLINCTYKNKILSLTVNREIFDYLCKTIEQYVKNRQSKSEAVKIARMYFLIAFLARENLKPINNELFYCISENRSTLNKYKEILQQLNLLEIEYKKLKLSIKGNPYKESTSYKVLPIRYDSSNKEQIKLSYCINNITYNSPYSIISKQTQAKSICINELCSQNHQISSLEQYLNFYNELVVKYDGTINEDLTNMLRISKAYLNYDNRIYHTFQSGISKEERKYVYLDDEPLVEAFDVSNCQHTLLNALISNVSNIPENEKRRYYELTCSGKFYEDISAYFSHKHNRSKGFYDREFIKDAVNKYYNITNKVIKNSHSPNVRINKNIETIDDYFKDNFPHIRTYISNNKEKAFPDDKDRKLNKLHLKLNEVETNIITREICINELYNKYHIKSISLHDGIYLRKCDLEYLNEHQIKLEKIFYDKLFMYTLL